MLELAQEALEVRVAAVAFVENMLQGGVKFVNLAGGKFDGACDAIKDPAQEFFVGFPDAITLVKFLLRDGVFALVSCHGHWWEH